MGTPTTSAVSSPDLNVQQTAMLVEIATLKGSLNTITQLLQQGQSSTEKRLDNMQRTFEVQLGDLNSRMSTLETNERSTAIRTAGVSAVTSAIVAAGMALLKYKS